MENRKSYQILYRFLFLWLILGFSSCGKNDLERFTGTEGLKLRKEAPCILDDITLREIQCDRIRYTISVPEKCPETGCGVIFDVHGRTMDAKVQNNNTGLRELANPAGYIVVQPSAPNKDWKKSYYPFLTKFIQGFLAGWSVDLNKIHITGFSQGAVISWHMACELGDVFASIAPISYAGGTCYGTGTEPQTSILYHHGEQDLFSRFPDALDTSNRVIESLALVEQKRYVSPDNSYERIWYQNTFGTEFQTIFHKFTNSLIFGKGHCFPNPPVRNNYGCRQSPDYIWGEEVLKFFQQNSKDKQSS